MVVSSCRRFTTIMRSPLFGKVICWRCVHFTIYLNHLFIRECAEFTIVFKLVFKFIFALVLTFQGSCYKINWKFLQWTTDGVTFARKHCAIITQEAVVKPFNTFPLQYCRFRVFRALLQTHYSWFQISRKLRCNNLQNFSHEI